MIPNSSPEGREMAIEALIDLDPNGPLFRFEKIMREAPGLALAARPNLITRSSLIESAKSLSHYEISDGKYLSYQHTAPPSSETDQHSGSAVLPTVSKELFPITSDSDDTMLKKDRDGIMKTAYPPPQLVAALRKMDGSSDDLLRSVSSHPVFASNSNEKSEESGSSECSTDDETMASSSSLANIELIVGNARKIMMETSDTNEALQGLLIAASSVLTGCVLTKGSTGYSIRICCDWLCSNETLKTDVLEGEDGEDEAEEEEQDEKDDEGEEDNDSDSAGEDENVEADRSTESDEEGDDVDGTAGEGEEKEEEAPSMTSNEKEVETVEVVSLAESEKNEEDGGDDQAGAAEVEKVEIVSLAESGKSEEDVDDTGAREEQKLDADLAESGTSTFESVDSIPATDVLLQLLYSASQILEKKGLTASVELHPRSTTLNLLVVILSILATTREEALRDPAFAVMGYVDESDDPAGSGSQDPTDHSPLEEKGMFRKAAAAAEHALLRQNRLKLCSQCCYITTKCLRHFLQASPLSSSESILRERLSSSLATFTNPQNAELCHEIIRNVSSHGIGISRKDLLPTSLLFEASALWGESIIILHQTQIEEWLSRLLKICYPLDADGNPEFPSDYINSCNAFPWSERQESFLKLESMCTRLCSNDSLEMLVASPIKYDVESSSNSEISGAPSPVPSSMLSALGEVLLRLPDDISIKELSTTRLYYALYNRCNCNFILWDNFAFTAGDCSLDEDNTCSTKVLGDESKTILSSSSSFDFDSSRCAESISVTPGKSNLRGPSANQRASKVWGTVLSTKHYSPKTGIHRWAVKLDKCERGHVFVGVATSRASTKTYVGGDKNGWGVIGTQALWHDRRKIRGDYGGTFRTGAIVVVTLDTDSGTLSYGLWHDHQSEMSREDVSSEQMMQNGGYLEDWGIAFEGLPLDAKLYPAIGLYQRDDCITLFNVEKELDDFATLGTSGGTHHGGKCFFPTKSDDEIICGLSRKWNHAFCERGIVYMTDVLKEAIALLSRENSDENGNHSFFHYILPSVASCLCLYPSSIPQLSGAAALSLLPLVIKCASLVDARVDGQDNVQLCSLLCNAANHLMLILKAGAPSEDVSLLMELPSLVKSERKQQMFELLSESTVLSFGMNDMSIETLNGYLDKIQNIFAVSEDSSHADFLSTWEDDLRHDLSKCEKQRFQMDKSKVEEIDEGILPHSGGCGSLSPLDKTAYGDSRRSIIFTFLYHSGLLEKPVNCLNLHNEDVLDIWKTSLKIMESGVRTFMTSSPNTDRKSACKTFCGIVQCISSFLARLQRADMPWNAIKNDMEKIYCTIKCEDDVTTLEEIMKVRTLQCVLRYAALSFMKEASMNVSTLPAVECITGHLGSLAGYYSRKRVDDSMIGCSARIQQSIRSISSEIFSSLVEKISTMTKDLSPEVQFIPVSLQSLLLMTLSNSFVYLKGKAETYLFITDTDFWSSMKAIFSRCRSILHQHGDDDVLTGQSRQVSLDILRSLISLLHTLLFQLTKRQDIDRSASVIEMLVSILKDEIDTALEFTRKQFSQHSRTVGESLINKVEVVETVTSHDHYLVHLLNATCSLFGSTKIDDGTAFFGPEWIHCLMDNVASVDTSVCSLPPKFRLRILRMIRLVLPETTPTVHLVNTMFSRVGYILDSGGDSPQQNIHYEHLELKEMISLLRHLYIFDAKDKDTSWSKLMTSIISDSWGKGAEEKLLQLGVSSFLGGLPGRIALGSYVLLKPSAAASLSTPSSASFFSKGQGASGGSSSSQNGYTPILAGNGMESIVAGLCREEAMAGMISHIDAKHGICEVILCDRKIKEIDGDFDLSSTVTVRAVRVSLNDVVSAEENPLLIRETVGLTKTIGASFISASQSIDAAKNVDKEEKTSTMRLNLMSGITSLRSNTVLLSSSIALSKYLEEENREFVQNHISKVLEMASSAVPKEGCAGAASVFSESLCALPEYEARFWHLQGMLSDLSCRQRILMSLSMNDFKEVMDMEKTSTPEKKKEEEGYSTPPATLGLATESLFSSRREEEEDKEEQQEKASQHSHEEGENEDEEEEEENEDEEASQHDEENEDEDDEEEEASQHEEEDAHLREAAIVQMAELGLPRSWSEYALRRVGGTNIEAAVHFCLERSGDMERLLAEEQERETRSSSSSSNSGRRRNQSASGLSHLMRQLVEMGFPPHWCAEALAANGHNVDEALTWILTNGERLGALDEGNGDEAGEEDDDEAGEEEEDDEEKAPEVSNEELDSETKKIEKFIGGWKEGIVCPLRSISGRTKIDSRTLEITGHPNGGFSSVGMKGIPLHSGKWYYEAVLVTAGCLQIGFADSSFAGHCQADNGDGCGDGPSSWAYDGWRRYRWHSSPTEWGCRWKEGDVVGCLLDMDEKKISFTLNGCAEEIGMGVAFSGDGFRPCGGVYACVSFNRKEKIRLVLGDENNSFYYPPPPGYKGVRESVISMIEQRDLLLIEEEVLNCPDEKEKASVKKYLCDFSDAEHGHELFSWQHRYYGSDASVHLGSSNRTSRNRHKNRHTLKGIESDGRTLFMSSVDDILDEEQNSIHCSTTDSIINSFQSMYDKATEKVTAAITENLLALLVLYARKFIYHIVVSQSCRFDFELLHNKNLTQEETGRQFWNVIEKCCSLYTAGWVGEAGAMAIASEALGLGISSQEQSSHSETLAMPSGKVAQFLSTVKILSSVSESVIHPSTTLAACAEAALGGDGGGSIVFLRSSLRNAILKSDALLKVIVAVVRRSIRQIASIEYSSDESSFEGGPNDLSNYSQDEDTVDSDEGEQKDLKGSRLKPDARLVSFLTGLLLDEEVYNRTVANENGESVVASSLFEAWSLGLFSASAPWRMICSLTSAGILNRYPEALSDAIARVPALKNFYSRLESVVARRMFAERAAVPICSKYIQALIELLSSVKRATSMTRSRVNLPLHHSLTVDAATPMPLSLESGEISWEWEENWVGNDDTWETLTGSVEFLAVDWTIPTRSAVRSLMDGGEGPPMLREGCTVIRGPDWEEDGSGVTSGDEDGKELYDTEKAKREEQDHTKEEEDEDMGEQDDNTPKKKKRIPNPKLPIGRVLSIESWKGVPGLARKVKWDLTGEEGIYRFGGDGGRYDVTHVDVNDKGTRIRKRHPIPESAEQCASRYGFGTAHTYHVILRVRRQGKLDTNIDDKETIHDGILEWPDFGAAVLVECRFYDDGAISITEKKLLYGSKDSGWEARFGQPSFVPGSTTVLSATNVPSSCTVKEDCEIDDTDLSTSFYEELLGSSSYLVDKLRNRADGSKLRVTSEMRLLRCRRSEEDHPHNLKALNQSHSLLPPPIYFDSNCHASSLSLSRDGRTVTCQTSDGRGTAYGSIGFTKGVHYWEVKIEQADIGSIFIGVAPKPPNNGGAGGNDIRSKLNRWHGLGFVNFRATYSEGGERVYGAHCHAGDVIGVLLDCDAGRLSFFFDGVKYGEHILNDLGCAFENISPFGFNADGCGSGGAGSGAPNGGGDGLRSGRYLSNGSVRPKALWPVVGLRTPGDRVTITGKWMTSYSIDGVTSLQNTMKVDEIMSWYDSLEDTNQKKDILSRDIPNWLIHESFKEYEGWRKSKSERCTTRGNAPHQSASPGLETDFNTSPISCAAACACLGLNYALLPGDRVHVKRSSGRLLELAEEAEIVGVYQGRLWYKLISQKSEGGSLSEGGDRAWFWDESEVVDGGLQLVGEGRGKGVELPLLERFKCPSKGGLRVVYKGGAVVRSDLEIFDGSSNVGTVPYETVIPRKDVLERRINSCGVVRYRVRFEELESGWISRRIRGGDEEVIVEPVSSSDNDENDDNESNTDDETYYLPYECAKRWLANYEEKFGVLNDDHINGRWSILNVEEFEKCLSSCTVNGMSIRESDSFIASLVGTISDYTPRGDAVECSFDDIVSSLCYGMNIHGLLSTNEVQDIDIPELSKGSNQAVAAAFSKLTSGCPSIQSLLARIAMLRSINRRVRYALPWLSLRPPQESSAVLGGLSGFGASVERVGRSLHNKAMETWVSTSSIGTRMRLCRSIIFSSVKRSFLDSVINATTTPTSLSHDEYELPREVRTVRVNRLKARRSMSSTDASAKKKNSVFSQLQSEINGWSGAALRRGHVAKGHGGQKRAFKVKLIGEGVNDYSGPYREVFTDAVREIGELGSDGRCSLDVLQPTPNKSVGIGEDRDLYVFSSVDSDTSRHVISTGTLDDEEAMIRDYYSSFMITKSERLREIEDRVSFLGKISATALRHGIPVDLSLPLGLVWKSLCEDESNNLDNMKEIDTLAYRHLLEENVKENDVKSKSPQLQVQQRILNSFAEGMSGIIPLEIFSMFTGEEVRDIFCGSPDVDVDLLKKVVEYEGYTEEDEVISYFWETLREMTAEERKLFLQFVWARTRLPVKESDFEAPFKIQKDNKSKGESTISASLPSASTCFFTLALPDYSDKDTLKKKLLFAIKNVTTMESDYVTNDAEVGEGWRGL